MPTYIRVRDDFTGHEYDCDQRSLRYGMTPIPGYPAVTGETARPRSPKHHLAKDGTAAGKPRTKPAPRPAPSTPEPAEPATPASDPAQPEGAQTS